MANDYYAFSQYRVSDANPILTRRIVRQPLPVLANQLVHEEEGRLCVLDILHIQG